ncbi:head closure [Mycobacterium phage MooMoo]|uniref:Head-to-tail stopper n=1 Tax=Mycobacterium phage MooMoo TaxID=2108127 RepID=A0A2P1JR35_9CAUD|nr:head closure [Mycobacterium phage MooMoo]AVO21614.1 head-to-tail stopper [Mycobacterium phage MooMoo]
MSFGGQVVAFVTITKTGEPGWGGLKEPSRTAVRVPGCHFRPANAAETPDEQTNVATEWWKLTAPAVEAVIEATAGGEIVYDGTEHPEELDLDSDEGIAATFQIDGPIRPKYDLDRLHHVTVMCKRQVG